MGSVAHDLAVATLGFFILPPPGTCFGAFEFCAFGSTKYVIFILSQFDSKTKLGNRPFSNSARQSN